ncbi:MAG TPA: GNAT family N-acetyltransferase, partial [Anaerolineales bacterium]|nr:GNAT family N-acetyltransferase [Anaerolineales bacterium]
IADLPDEFEQIFRLNYKTFVEEIPQHEVSHERRLVDKFHAENTYIICKDGEKLLGMLAVRDKRPFSLDLKLNNLDSYLPTHKSLCEIRLLAVEPDWRKTRVCAELLLRVGKYCDEHRYDLAIMSGTTRQLKMYRHLGFIPFGPLVGKDGADYQPMYLTLDSYRKLTATARIFIQPFLT